MKKPCLFLLVLSLLFSFGCSKQAGKSEAKFKIGLAALADINAVGAGGAMLWGRSDKGDMFGSVITPSSGFELSLVNGNWTFWSVAWEGDGSGAPFSGSIRCAKNAAVLNGTDVQVSMSLSNSKCDLPDFTPSVAINAGVKQFPDISTYECQKITDHNGIGCGTGTAKAKTTSRRLVLSSFIKPAAGGLQVLPGKLVSECKATGVNFIKEHLPLGNGFLPALTFLESFYSSISCDESDPKGFRRAVYEYGLLGTARLDTIKFVNEGSCNAYSFSMEMCTKYNGMWAAGCSLSSSQYEISQEACVSAGGTYTSLSNKKSMQLITSIPEFEVCSGVRANVSNVSPHPFASGDGSISAPYTICRESQLNKIGESSTTYTSSHFTLQADLDMNKTSIISNGEQPMPACSSSRPGANFTPIGGLYDSGCSPIAAETFSGSFDGNNHTISNIRLNENDVDNLGFVRVGGSISNLALKNLEIEGKDKVAAISGSGATLIKNIKVMDADIRGESNVAGVAGMYTGTNEIFNVHANKVRIRGESTNVTAMGGLVANTDAASLTIRQSSFEGTIGGYSSTEMIGGLVGKGTSGINLYIKESFSNGAILWSGTTGAYAGGLVGNVSGFVNIENSYSQMDIAHNLQGATNEAGKAGGLVGYSTNTVTLNNSFYQGSIMLPCRKASSVYCSIGALIGIGSPTGANYMGSLTTPNWFNTPPTDHTTISTFEDGTLKASLMATGKFQDSGNPMPKLWWEANECALNVNNLAVGVQAATLARGTAANPVVLCNKEQWKQIKNNPSLFYSVRSNLSVGDITTSDMPTNFSGSIDGNGHLISGFLSTVPTGSGGLFVQNSGRINNIHFTAGAINSTGTAQYVGIVGKNLSSGIMTKNTFHSVVFSGAANTTGVIAGENSGLISHSRVDSFLDSGATTVGAIVGQNNAGATVLGIRATGSLTINGLSDSTIGGAVGKNSGLVQEVDSSVNITNMANTSSLTYIGGLIGINEGVIKDVLIRPHVTIHMANFGPQAGHVLGKATPTSQVIRLVAANEFYGNNGTTAYGSHFTVTNESGASYSNSFALQGAVYSYDTTGFLTVNSCNITGSVYSYVMTSPFNNDANYPNGFMLSSTNKDGQVGRRITGLHVDGTSVIDSTIGTHFTRSCSTGDVETGALLYPVVSAADFIAAGVTNIRPEDFSAFTTFCPSGASESGNGNFICSSGEFDIVEDEVGGIGFERIKSAFAAMVSNQPLPANRPVWTIDNDGHPRLFSVD
ncbi:hypothetical protein C0V70_09495 [Bacteriovorax stolpii]|uniref:GLUG domain-containing protein n=2 Tax=Bacteriovorax stolpii TaxID=960 RepID=A0A2K9NUA6_BACTC|nr:hypothetical protein C0V70_09495 [Bacteriovorax stolpii]